MSNPTSPEKGSCDEASHTHCFDNEMFSIIDHKKHLRCCLCFKEFTAPISDDGWVNAKLDELSDQIEHHYNKAVNDILLQIRGEITEDVRQARARNLDARTGRIIRDALIEAEKRVKDRILADLDARQLKKTDRLKIKNIRALINGTSPAISSTE